MPNSVKIVSILSRAMLWAGSLQLLLSDREEGGREGGSFMFSNEPIHYLAGQSGVGSGPHKNSAVLTGRGEQ